MERLRHYQECREVVSWYKEDSASFPFIVGRIIFILEYLRWLSRTVLHLRIDISWIESHWPYFMVLNCGWLSFKSKIQGIQPLVQPFPPFEHHCLDIAKTSEPYNLKPYRCLSMKLAWTLETKREGTYKELSLHRKQTRNSRSKKRVKEGVQSGWTLNDIGTSK